MKQGLADGSLGEGTGKKIGSTPSRFWIPMYIICLLVLTELSVEEWANLFGLDRHGRRLAAG